MSAAVPTVATIGVYGFDRDSFLAALAAAGVDLLLDVRQRRGEGKRSRTVISPEYAQLYTEGVLDRADLANIVRWIGSSHAALFCVERDPEACHRSLVAARLRDRFGFEVEDLRPE